MSKPVFRSYSRHAREAAELLGHLIRTARTEGKLTLADVAERAGTSRGLIHRIEKGDMGCSIGAVFEVAAIVGVRLFETKPATLTHHLAMSRDRLSLLPKAVRPGTTSVKDDF